MMSWLLKRVVMRTSVGWAPPVKGWTLTSRRPFSRSKPSATATSLHNAACFSTLNSPLSHELSGALPFSSMSLSKGTKPSFTSSKISVILAAVSAGA